MAKPEKSEVTTTSRPNDAFAALRGELDRVFQQFESGWPQWPTLFRLGSGNGAMLPELDVRENTKSITVEAELPGVAEKDIAVTLANGMLTIKGEKKDEREDKGDTYYVSERSFGSFQRSLRLPETIDESKVEARFDKGVLKVIDPEAARSRQSGEKDRDQEQLIEVKQRAASCLDAATLREGVMYKHILIATDGSELSAKANAHGLALAKAVGAKVTAVHVTESWASTAPSAEVLVSFPLEEYDKAMAARAQHALSAVTQEANKLGIACTTSHAKDQFPAEGILETAKARNCDLIVMASHGRRGLKRLLLGSQAVNVLTHSTLPVLICR